MPVLQGTGGAVWCQYALRNDGAPASCWAATSAPAFARKTAISLRLPGVAQALLPNLFKSSFLPCARVSVITVNVG